uniref:Uncharacterized protein n=1 Tax=Panagrolaimus davidi TaxID=227884 RepID=A0A914PYM9_9BILA
MIVVSINQNIKGLQQHRLKLSDSAIFDSYEGRKEKSQIWRKSSITDLCSNYSYSLTFNDENKKSWKKDKALTSKNNSTISLHIAAYENNVEISESDKLHQFELPRQQNEQSMEPELSQFRASQRLLNPNVALSSTSSNLNANIVQNARRRREANRAKDCGNSGRET